MTALVVDHVTVRRMLEDSATVPPGVTLLAPTLLRSEWLARLYTDCRAGRCSAETAAALRKQFNVLKLRYLGDKVLRARAWSIAEAAGAEDTYAAEYVALAQLQAEGLIAGDPAIAALAEGRIPLRDYAAVFGGQS